jgi:outer membrane protein assembly factor BamB
MWVLVLWHVAAAASPSGSLLWADVSESPSGSLLWADVSEAGLGANFPSAVPLAGSADVLVLRNMSLLRLQASSGKPTWSHPLKKLLHGSNEPKNPAVVVGTLHNGDETPVALVWASWFDESKSALCQGYYVAAVDVESGKAIWSAPLRIPYEQAHFSFSGGVFLGFGKRTGKSALAMAVSLTGSTYQFLFNFTAEEGPDGASVASLHNMKNQQQVALLGTYGPSGHEKLGTLYALNAENGAVLWTAPNITVTQANITDGVAVVSVISDSWNPNDQLICEVRGYALKDGAMLWERTSPNPTRYAADCPRLGFGRACDADCTLPCDLVAAGFFGALDPQTGRTVYNLTTAAGQMALKDGVAYTIGKDVDGLGNGTGVLRAQACAASHPGGTPEVLWSAPLPAGDSGGSAPWQKILVLDGSGGGSPRQPTLLIGGHQKGACSRGHCQPSHSAAAAIQAPTGIKPPPVPPPPPTPGPPPPPSKCQTTLNADCAAARAISHSQCLVCCGQNAGALQNAGCKESDFETFCSSK